LVSTIYGRRILVNIELKPCPFCGGKAIVTNWGMWRGWCTECKATASDHLTEKEAIEAWNKRT
jgi:Lar family restriction alleviation protein